MVKKLSSILIIVLLMCVSVSALAEKPMVIDDAGLFSISAIERMEDIITRIRNNYQIDAVVLTTQDTPRTTNDNVLIDYADRYFEDHGYGCGDDRAGVLYMIDMKNRFAYISTAGVMIDYLNDSRIDNILDESGEYMGTGRYGDAACKVLSLIENYLRQGIEEGQFRYDKVTGKRLSGLYNRLTTTEALFALAVGAGAAAILVFSVVGKYSLKGKTYRYNRSELAKCTLTQDEEQFLRQTVSRVRTPPPSSGGGGGGHSGGSGVHVSSGGMSHGGGGRHF